ncbi:MAG: hypothetical protein ACRDRX_06120 [Pseudonocardiaceae bacterium]
MDPLAPAVADAFGLLLTDLYRHLDGADSLSQKFEEWTEEDSDTARQLISDLVIVLRGLLLDHQVGRGGHCRTCKSAWPCPVVTLMHGLIKDPDSQFVELALRVNDVQ